MNLGDCCCQKYKNIYRKKNTMKILRIYLLLTVILAVVQGDSSGSSGRSSSGETQKTKIYGSHQVDKYSLLPSHYLSCSPK